MVTTKQIAEIVGVAVSTVGRALADDPRISDATKKRVHAAATKLGYLGNVPARVMRGGSSRLVGLIIPDVLNDFYATIAQELSKCCESGGYQLVLSIAADDRESELKRIQELAGARVAGIVIVPTATPRPETLKLLAGIPHVQFLRRLPVLDGDWFGIDDSEALAESTSFVLRQGHRRVAYVGGLTTLPTGRDRLAGYRRAHEAMRLSISTLSIKLGPPTSEFGLRATESLLKRKLRPTAIVFGSIQATIGGIEAIHRSHLSVPADVSIVGFGDPPWFALWGSGLTTVQLPMRELAQACGYHFLQRLDAVASAPSPVPAKPYEVVRDAALIVRGSTRSLV